MIRTTRQHSTLLRRRIFRLVFSLFAFCLGGVAQAQPMVGAYYFSGAWGTGKVDLPWHPDYGLPVGRDNDWWLGVRDFSGTSDYLTPAGNILTIPRETFVFSEDFSHLEPAIGFYNDSLPRTLEKHIRQAKSNGLSFFNFYWFWDSSTHSELQVESIDAFLRAENADEFKFMISISTGDRDNLDIPAADESQVIDLFIDKYMSHSSYLKTTDGRPMITLLGWKGIGTGTPQDANAFVGKLKAAALQELNVTPFVLTSVDLGGATQVTNGDAYTCLVNVPAISFPNTQVTHIDTDGDGIDDKTFDLDSGSQLAYNTNHVPQMQNNFSDKPFMPCYMTDFDEKPRLISKPWIQRIRQIDDWTEQGFLDGLRDVETFALGAADSAQIRNAVVLYSWNEWAEAGLVLEPNAPMGNQLLADVATEMQLSTYGDSDCRTLGECNTSCNCSYGNDDLGFYEPTYKFFWIHLSTGSSLDGRNWWTQFLGENAEERMVGDFNGDSLDDMARFDPVQDEMIVHLSTGSQLAAGVVWSQDVGLDADARFAGDYDGDGLDDIAVYSSSDGSLRVSLSNGTGFGASQQWASAGSISSRDLHVADLDGDKQDDLIHYTASPGSISIWLSDGTTFTHDPSWTVTLDQTPYIDLNEHNPYISERYVGDFNGDGLEDFGIFNGLAEFWVYLSTGFGMSQSSIRWTANAGWGNNDRFVGDFNGDGIDDLGIYAPQDTKFWVHLSTGDAFQGRTIWHNNVGWNIEHVIGNFDGL
ncbi:MAG: FG-GAP-like repeat-containing protein [Holophagales bacterium]|nr:FG-GAP-like repeat-containing protein [Holophagales bacterium]